MKIEKVDMKPEEPLAKEFIDHAYWEVGKPTPGEEIDYDSLLAELEAWVNYSP